LFTIKLPKIAAAAAGVFAVAVCLTAGGIIWGCGKKGPPQPPRGDSPPQVSDLAYSIAGSTVRLSWTLPRTTAKANTPVTGFLIYQYKQPAHERECSNCPVIFEKVGDVPVRGNEREQAGTQPIVFVQTLEPGYRYIFKVTAYNKAGVASKDSDRVEFQY
jgi:hypothetical protein